MVLFVTLNAKPPKEAVVLFTGISLDGWTKMDNNPAEWLVVDGAMQFVPRTGDFCTS